MDASFRNARNNQRTGHPSPLPEVPRALPPTELFQVLSPAKPDVPSWQAALATETARPRIRRSDDELKLERDFQLIADPDPGETDDPLALEDVATKPCSP